MSDSILGVWPRTQCLSGASGGCQGKTHYCFCFGQEESRGLRAGLTQEAEMLGGSTLCRGPAGSPIGLTSLPAETEGENTVGSE